MNTHVCQNCGSIVRKLGCKCSTCGQVVTAHSSTGVLPISTSPPPDMVAPPDAPRLAENMICNLHHAASAVKENGDKASPVSAAHGTGSCVALEEKPQARSSAVPAGDFFADVPVQMNKAENYEAKTESAAAEQYDQVKPEPAGNSCAASLVGAMPCVAPPEAPVPVKRTNGAETEPIAAGKTTLKESELSPDDTGKLIQRLVDANMSASLPAESDFFDNALDKREDLHAGSGAADRADDESEDRAAKSVAESEQVRRLSPGLNKGAAVIILLGFVFVSIFLMVGQKRPPVLSAIHSGLSATTRSDGAPASVAGTYSYWYIVPRRSKTWQPKVVGGGLERGSLSLSQDGVRISGDGYDYAIDANANRYRKEFRITGTYSKPELKFTKTYLRSGAEVSYEGTAADAANSRIQLSGTWYSGKSGTQNNKWGANGTSLERAKFTKLGSEVEQGKKQEFKSNEDLSIQNNGESNWLLNLLWPPKEPLFIRFLRLLAACIVFGLAVVHVSLKFFGMHGLINIWEREKYIPPAVRPQHLKLMSELANGKKHGLLLGERLEWGLHEFWRPQKLYLPADRREKNPHILAMGAGAKGKTRLLAGMIINDIKNDDRAVVVVDSEGALVELIKRWLGTCPEAKKMLQRVSMVDPCNSKCTLGFNPLSLSGSDSLQAQASAVVMGFKSVYTESQNQQNQWTQQTANILRNAVLLLMLNERNLEDLPVLLSDNDFRDVLLEKVQKDHAREWKTLVDAWANYKRLARSEQWLNWIEPILNRVQPLLSDQRIANLLNAKSDCVDLSSILQEKRILLVRVPEGQLEKGGNLLGSLIITGLRQAGLSYYERIGDPGGPCSLYLDEMNNFLDAESFEALCSDLRKVQIAICGTLKTLQDLNEEFRNRALLNFGTLAVFSVSKKDADTLGPTMFRVDGRKIKKVTPKDIFNPVNATPNMDFASDEEKININRLVGQDERNYFCHLLGTEAGVFRMKAPLFKDIARGDVNWDLIESFLLKQGNEDEEG